MENLSELFSIKNGVRQGCPLLPILFNLVINDIFNECDKYGFCISDKRCCGGLFADDIVLSAPTWSQFKKLLKLASRWANYRKNEMQFSITIINVPA